MNAPILSAPRATAISAGHRPPSGAAPVGGERRIRSVYGRRGPRSWVLRHPVTALLAVAALGYVTGALLRVDMLPDPSRSEPGPF